MYGRVARRERGGGVGTPNRTNKEAIVESDESNPAAKVGKGVPAVHLGLSTTGWDQALEVEAFLDQPFALKEAIEHKTWHMATRMVCVYCVVWCGW